MDFTLEEEQRAIAALAEALFRDHCSDDLLSRFEASGKPFDQDLWAQLGSAGLLTAPDPEKGFGMTELALVLEQQGRFLARVPLWRHQLSAAAVASFAPDSIRNELIADLEQGAILATLSVEEIELPRLHALMSEGRWHFSGEVAAVAYGAQADWGLFPVVADGETRLALLALKDHAAVCRPGLLTNGEPVADLIFDQHTSGLLLPAQADGPWLLARASACVAALQIGVAAEALRRTADYVAIREQFGRSIGTFQGVALRAADGYIDLEVARGALWQLVWRLDAGREALAAAHVAKYWSAQCGHRVSHTAMHLHGGIGADISYPIHRFFLWSRALELSAGGSQIQLTRIGALMAADDSIGVQG